LEAGYRPLQASKLALVITPRLSPADLPTRHVYTLEPGHPTPGRPNLLRPPIALQFGAGILTRFPSTTALALILGADSPCADARGAGNLGLTATRTFTLFIATHVSIRTSDTSSRGHPPPSPAYGTLSYRPGVRSQLTEVSNNTASLGARALTESLQHLGDLDVLIAPNLPCRLGDVPQVMTISKPYPHLIRRANRHR
jgi:hypothetical protein